MSKLYSLFAVFLIVATNACASSQNEIQVLLNQQDSPSGVVFEIVSFHRDALKTAIPQIIKYSSLLRERFPKISIAVVSHGNEQFSLTTKNKSAYETVHKQIKTLGEQQNIPVHICATYASHKGVAESEFPEYINVAASGPSQIANYRELGFVLIKISD